MGTKIGISTNYSEHTEPVMKIIKDAGVNGVKRSEISKKLGIPVLTVTQSLNSSFHVYEDTIKGELYYYYCN